MYFNNEMKRYLQKTPWYVVKLGCYSVDGSSVVVARFRTLFDATQWVVNEEESLRMKIFCWQDDGAYTLELKE